MPFKGTIKKKQKSRESHPLYPLLAHDFTNLWLIPFTIRAEILRWIAKQSSFSPGDFSTVRKLAQAPLGGRGTFAHLEGSGYSLSSLSKSLPSVQFLWRNRRWTVQEDKFCILRWEARVVGRGEGFIRREGDGNGEKEAEIGRVFAVLYPPFITFSRDITIL